MAKLPKPRPSDPAGPATPRPGWDYPGPSRETLAAVLGDEDAQLAGIALDRAPAEIRVLADLLARVLLQLDSSASLAHPMHAPPDEMG